MSEEFGVRNAESVGADTIRPQTSDVLPCGEARADEEKRRGAAGGGYSSAGLTAVVEKPEHGESANGFSGTARRTIGPYEGNVGGDPQIAPPTGEDTPAPVGEGLAPPAENTGEKAGRASPAPTEDAPDLTAHYASLCAQAAALAAEIPGFSLDEALCDRDFLRLTSPAVGVSVRSAWYALHGAEREAQAARRAREEAAAALAVSAARPREGGRGLHAGTLSTADPRCLDREAREALRQRIRAAASRGEKLYP